MSTFWVPLRPLLAALWARADAVSIRVKIMGIALALVLLLGVGTTLITRARLSATLGEQLEKRALSIARDLAARSTDPILINDTVALGNLIREAINTDEDLGYVYILTPEREVLAHSFGPGFPIDLLQIPVADKGRSFYTELLATERGRMRHLSVPIFDGRAGTMQVGMSLQGVEAAVHDTTRRLAAATLSVSLGSVLLALLLTVILTHPVLDLTEAAKAISTGDLRRSVRVRSRDEIGDLGQAFNRMTENLRQKEAMRLELLQKVIHAQEEERKRVARELHDETSQSLASLMIALKVIESAQSHQEVQEHCAALRTLIAQTLENVHRLALELRPRLLDDLGLEAALKNYIDDYVSQFRLHVNLQTIGLGQERVPPEIEIVLYRIIQESLTNTARHAQAHTVSILLQRRPASILALVEDDGCGFDLLQALDGPSNHLGIFGMQERAQLVGGRLAIESSPGHGTTVMVEIPLEKEVPSHGAVL